MIELPEIGGFSFSSTIGCGLAIRSFRLSETSKLNGSRALEQGE